jgi:cytochrome c oxidase assembly protein subunit 15
MSVSLSKIKTYAKFTRVNLAYTLLVILWGAYVRASGSGAGCGAHWPLCNGEVLPRPERIQTVVEFMHRGSSGVSLTLVMIGFGWAWVISEKGSLIRKAAAYSVMASDDVFFK